MPTTQHHVGSGGVVTPTIEFNPLSPEFIADPYPFYRRLLAEAPVHYNPLGAWVLSRYADVSMALRDPCFGRAGSVQHMLTQLGEGPVLESFSRWMLFLDPPAHSRLRTLVSKAFTPRAVEAMRPHIQQLVDNLLDPIQAAGAADLMPALAYPLPVMVICDLLGVPAADRDTFRDWSFALALALDISYVTPEIVERGNASAQGLTDYFRHLVAHRRTQPGADLLSALIAAEEQGDRLTEDELLATCVLLFFAGHETTVNLIGNGVLALLRHPDQLRKLQADPSLIQNAVEELLRYDGPVQRTARVANTDLELDGQTIRAGQRVGLLLGAAHRDPAQFPDPDRLDVTRRDTRSLAFGAGIHYCLGAPLARVEAQLAINTLLRRLPDLELRTESPEWRQTSLLRGLKALPVGW